MESVLLGTNKSNDGNQMDAKNDANSGKTIKGVGKRILKVQARRFRMETKAAKTLAIIVGGFICCWLPFFTMYLIRAFCPACIQPLLFSVLFWLGYCNSAINPLIYALFSKEFRLAFTNIICKCLCARCYNEPQTNSSKNLIQNCSADGSRSRWRSSSALRKRGSNRRKKSVFDSNEPEALIVHHSSASVNTSTHSCVQSSIWNEYSRLWELYHRTISTFQYFNILTKLTY